MRCLLVIAIMFLAGCSVRIEHTPECKCKEKQEAPSVLVKKRIFT